MGGLKRIGGAFGERAGAETLNRLGAPEIKALLDKYLPPTASEYLFRQLVGHEANIPVSPYLQSIQKVKKDIATSSRGYRQETYGGLKRNIEGSEEQISYDTVTHQPVLPADKLQREMHDVGKHTKATDSMVRGEYRQLFGGLSQSLEQAAMPGSKGEILKEAREAFKREMVLKDIAKLARPFTMSGLGDVERFRANKIINRLSDPDDELAKFYKQSFTPAEQQDIMNHLVTLNKIPPIPAPKGVDTGSKERLGQIASVLGTAGAGSVAGGMTGMSTEGAALGAGLGYAIPKLATMLRNYNIANNTVVGKKLIAELWKGNGGKFSPQFWSALEGFAAAQAAHPELFEMAGEQIGLRRRKR